MKASKNKQKITMKSLKIIFEVYLGINSSNPSRPLKRLKKRNPFIGFIEMKRTNKDPIVYPKSPIESRMPL